MYKSELRIGNYVSFSDRHIGEVFDKVSELCHDYLKIENEGYQFDYNAVKPIPLTSSILESCGFKDDKIENDKFKFEVYYYDSWNIYFEEKEKYGNSKCKLIGFYDFHQLQNIYYALTGEEIEIKL